MENPTMENVAETYVSYKETGVDWLGKIPSHWVLKKGKWLFIKQERPTRFEDEVVTAFRNGQVTLRSNRREDGFTNALLEHGYQGIRKGDLIIHAMDAFAGAIGVSDSDGKSTPVYAVCTPKNKNEVIPYFYAYYLRNLAKTGFIESLAKGIRERSTDFRYKDFGALLLPVPPLAEQERIATFLDRKTADIDRAIAQKERLIALLHEQRQVLIHRAVTRGLNPDVPLKSSGVDWLGDIPAHWEVKRVKNIFRLVVEPAPINNNEELLSVYTEIGVKPRKELEEKGNRASTTDGYWYVKKGDIVVNKLLAWMGAIGLSNYNGVTSPAYDILRPKIEISGEYFHCLFRMPTFSSELKKHSRGIMDMRLRLYFDKFGDVIVPFPPVSEQEYITIQLKEINSQLEIMEKKFKQQIAYLNEYKATLIHSAVTGQIKI